MTSITESLKMKDLQITPKPAEFRRRGRIPHFSPMAPLIGNQMPGPSLIGRRAPRGGGCFATPPPKIDPPAPLSRGVFA